MGKQNRRPLPKSSAPLCSSGAHPNASAALSWASRAEKDNEKLRRKRISEEAGGGGGGCFSTHEPKDSKGSPGFHVVSAEKLFLNSGREPLSVSEPQREEGRESFNSCL